VPSIEFLLISCAAIALVAGLAIREHRAARQLRGRMLDACAALFDRPVIEAGADGFPELSGRWKGSEIRVALIADTMTIRRLPQIWLSVTRLDAHPGRPGLAALVRPSGADFYSLTERFSERFETPPGLPGEIWLRGSSPAAQSLLNRAACEMANVFADACVKEIAMTDRGVRIIRQAAEGRRGPHLILRQVALDDCAVSADLMAKTLAELDRLTEAVAPPLRAVSAA
jgi:hypothetical protein